MIDIDVSKIISEIGEPKARLIENEDDKRQRKITLISSFVFLFLFICGTITFFVLGSQARAFADKLKSEVAVIKENNEPLLKSEEEAQIIVRRNQSISQILNNNANWSYVLDKLEEVVLKGIIFNNFTVASQSDMQISGTSPDYVELSKLVVAMKDSGYFGNVNLASASLSPASRNEVQVVDFTITFGFATKFDRETLKKDDGSQGSIVTPDIPGNMTFPGNEEGEDVVSDPEEKPVDTGNDNGQLPVL